MSQSTTNTLIIAEKPSLARAIASALPQPQQRREGYIEAANGVRVTWCFGHLLEQVQPQSYDPRYKQWCLRDLPIVPKQWQLAARKDAKKQLAIIGRLLTMTGQLVNAGDPDREGQLLVDEVIEHHYYKAKSGYPVQRLLISDLNLEAVQRALSSMRPNAEFAALSLSALARSRADWLYGLNMTRAYTLLGQKAGYQGVLSVGRVQTPVLGLVVRRCDEIANFKSKPFYQVHALIPHQGQDIRALWKPSEACTRFQDAEGRVLHKQLAENVIARIAGQPALLKEADHKKSLANAPLPFSLSALQIEAARRFGFSAADVLASAQRLYETHRAITYPRSDCRYLPEAHFTEGRAVCSAIAATDTTLATHVVKADLSLRSKAWSDKKVGAHHAIVPTSQGLKAGSLKGKDAKIYNLIARQYLMQFYPAAQYAQGQLVFQIGTGTFVAKGKDLLSPGWRVLLLATSKSDDSAAYVPILKPGSRMTCREGVIGNKKTEAPKAFTDATILQAMTSVGRFVDNPELRKILRDTDGLGTEATRASILETLFRRALLVRSGKKIEASEAGRALIYALPKLATLPDMTAHWERNLREIAEGQYEFERFMKELELKLLQLLIAPRDGTIPISMRNLKTMRTKPVAQKQKRKQMGNSPRKHATTKPSHR